MAASTNRGSFDNPAWVHALLAQPWVVPLVRLALVSAYLIGGVAKVLADEGQALIEADAN